VLRKVGFRRSQRSVERRWKGGTTWMEHAVRRGLGRVSGFGQLDGLSAGGRRNVSPMGPGAASKFLDAFGACGEVYVRYTAPH
jgi:hypothetical protein